MEQPPFSNKEKVVCFLFKKTKYILKTFSHTNKKERRYHNDRTGHHKAPKRM